MRLVRTVKLRLQEAPQVFQPTIDAYTKAFNLTCQTGWCDNDFNGVSLHNKVYKQTREYLPSQLAVSARMKATEALKSVRKKLNKNKNVSCPQSRQTSIRYDARSYNVWFDREEISLSTVDGRKFIKIVVPEYFKQYLSWKRCSADLFIRSGKVFLNIVVEKEIRDFVSSGTFIGVDRGIKKLAVTSDKRFFGGGKVKQISSRYQRLRSALQSKGHSGKRHLAKIRGKENRFRRDVNHCISKQIVSTLESGATIILENLTNIRDRSKKLRKAQRAEMNRWSFYQLEEFLKYKAFSKGIDIQFVSAVYTSRGCSKCSHVARGNRVYQSMFKCKKCGYQCNADLNASFNIVLNYLDAIGYPDRVSQRTLCSQEVPVEQSAGFGS